MGVPSGGAPVMEDNSCWWLSCRLLGLIQVVKNVGGGQAGVVRWFCGYGYGVVA